MGEIINRTQNIIKMDSMDWIHLAMGRDQSVSGITNKMFS
jgi:hypothetical protein